MLRFCYLVLEVFCKFPESCVLGYCRDSLLPFPRQPPVNHLPLVEVSLGKLPLVFQVLTSVKAVFLWNLTLVVRGEESLPFHLMVMLYIKLVRAKLPSVHSYLSPSFIWSWHTLSSRPRLLCSRPQQSRHHPSLALLTAHRVGCHSHRVLSFDGTGFPTGDTL